MFSILIPTWNNLNYLKTCIHGIRKNSAFQHQIIVHVNDGSDGTLSWIRQEKIDFTHSSENIGICKAVNKAAVMVQNNYVVFMNDDMYPLPGWDTALFREITNAGTDLFMFSSTMIEPYNTGNNCVIVADYGRETTGFKEDLILKEYNKLPKEDWSGSCWPPNVVHKKWWDNCGGYSEEFSPGMSSDDDFAMKMWSNGCRIFKGVSDSRVYHFISKSTGRVDKNDGRKQFKAKWGIKQSLFHRYYLRRGQKYTGTLTEPSITLPYLFEKHIASRF